MTEKSKGILYLIPSPIASDNIKSIPAESLQKISELHHFICERARTTRRTIKRLHPSIDISTLNILEGGHQFSNEIIEQAIQWLNEGKDLGLMSEAGSPAIADPGAKMVLKSHQEGIRIVPFVGPNSIVMALMASGLGGQEFCFHGYLPHKKDKLLSKLNNIIQSKNLSNYTHICIEAPYRNQFLFKHLKMTLAPNTLLCIAAGIQSEREHIQTKNLANWQEKEIKPLHKVPCIFLFKI